MNEGWGLPPDARREHYFRGYVALCDGRVFMGRLAAEVPSEYEGTKAPPSDCAICWRRRKRERIKQQVKERNERRRALSRLS